MKELSLHILDIVQNSIAAKATKIELTVIENPQEDVLSFMIRDNGCGMSEEMVKTVTDPFVTGRTTRKVGLGIPLLKAAAEQTGGRLTLASTLGEGTQIYAEFGYQHMDRQPLGDMAETMLGLICAHPDLDFVCCHRVNQKEYRIDTQEMRAVLDGVSFNEPAVMQWLSAYLKENEAELYHE